MPETYNSVLDRMGAFNAATENMAKGRAKEIRISVRGGGTLRLVKTPENYSIEIAGVPAEAAEALAGMGFEPLPEGYGRAVSKAERSWNVASQLEDLLQDVLQLAPDVSVTIDTVV
jgi:hypothetical protein